MATNLQIENAVSQTVQTVKDQDGNTSSLNLSTDKVGIGMTDPQGTLDVSDNIVLNGNIKTQLSATGDSTVLKGGLIVLDLSPVGGGQLQIGSNTNDDKIFLEGFSRDGNGHASEMLITGKFAKSLPLFSILADIIRLLGTVKIGESFNANFTLSPSDASPNAGYIRFGDNTGWKLHFGRSREESAGILNTGTNGALMTIQDNGNVGIGTTDPGEKLEVRGGMRTTGNIIVQGVSFAGLVQTIKQLEERVVQLEQKVAALGSGSGGGTTPPSRRISIAKEGAGSTTVFVVTGTGFTPNSLVVIRITTPNLDQLQFPETAGADGKFVSRHSVSCVSGSTLTFTAFEDANPANTQAVPVVTTCP